MYIALKEIRRSLGRFVLLTSAVALLVLLLLFFQAVAGTLTSGLTGAFEQSTAEIFVYDDRARLNPSASVLEPGIVDEVAAIEGVSAAAGIGITVVAGTLEGGEAGQLDVALFGGDPQGPTVPATVTAGRLPEADDEALASGSALDAAFAVDDRFTVGSRTFTVVGTADDAAFSVLPTLYVPERAFAEVVSERAGGEVDVPFSLVGVTVEDGRDPVEVAGEIGDQVAAVEALDRDAAVAELPGVGQITQSFSILYLLLFVVVTIVTGVFFLILTVQKKDALVLLQAVGGGRRDVLVPVLLQVVLVTGVGAVVGALTAGGLLWVARDVFGAALDPATAATTVVAILLLGLLASLGAVRRVLITDPIDAVTTSRI